MSWSGKGEEGDFGAVVGFMAWYLHFLTGRRRQDDGGEGGGVEWLLEGYSYGGLVLARLPSVEEMIARVGGVEVGSAAAEIVVKARAQAEKQSGCEIMAVEQDGLQALPKVSLVRYLLVSPVLLPFTNMLCPPGASTSILSFRRQVNGSGGTAAEMLLRCPTLAIFGSSDGFTSSRRLKAWSEAQCAKSTSSFQWSEVDRAGHFWREEGVMQELQERVAEWVRSG